MTPKRAASSPSPTSSSKPTRRAGTTKATKPATAKATKPTAAKATKPATAKATKRAATPNTAQAAKPAAAPKRATAARNRRGKAHLRSADPVLRELIDAVGPLPNASEGRPDKDDHYGALLRAIVGQQLSVLAARAIYNRLLDRFGGKPPKPRQILADEPEELRAAVGLSRAKVGFLRSLAEHVLDGELELPRLDELPDEQVIEELTAVKGLGVWTSHMFLMFHLERLDVLAVGDLGIRRAIELAYDLKELPDAATMEAIAEPWRPYRTLACRYLWRSLSNEPT
ncbi:MAG TPA: DNA-3-methyladenine glycosylase [Solirubrobacteraceae bacterium]